MRKIIFVLIAGILFFQGCSNDEKREENSNIVALNRGVEMKTKTAFKGLITAISQYSIDTGERPETSDMDELCNILTPTYISVCSVNDGWGNRLKCNISSDDESYFLSAGKDGVFGTEDDIKEVF